jgi:hypothetical protein
LMIKEASTMDGVTTFIQSIAKRSVFLIHWCEQHLRCHTYKCTRFQERFQNVEPPRTYCWRLYISQLRMHNIEFPIRALQCKDVLLWLLQNVKVLSYVRNSSLIMCFRAKMTPMKKCSL